MSKLIRVSSSKYRVVLTDLLPYEKPVFFTNRFFSRFLKKYGVRTEGERLVATNPSDADGRVSELLKILSGENDAQRKCYQYKIAKNNEEEGRVLSVIHPYHQVKMLEFYDKYKMVMIDFCNRSHFSVRYPCRVAKYHKQPKSYPSQFDDRKEVPANVTKEKSFFAYKEYRNINAFYDDYRFLRAEKRFDLMYKVDLKQCFESISPDVLAKAMFNDANYNNYRNFASDFKALQESFGNEKGIVIGPEFSRIFAEIVLQRIDLDIEQKLLEQGLKLKRDYLIYRYVDDSFIFCKKENQRILIEKVYDDCVWTYGLERKPDKSKIYRTKPFLDNISMVKFELGQLVKESFQNRHTTLRGYARCSEGYHYDLPFILDVKNFLKSYRMIMGRCQMSYIDSKLDEIKDKVTPKETMGFLLERVRREVTNVIQDFDELYREYCESEIRNELNAEGKRIKVAYENGFTHFAINLTEILFYLFSTDRRMATSAKIVRIINMLQLYVKGRYVLPNNLWTHKFSSHSIAALEQKITAETCYTFENIERTGFNHLEMLNLLELQKDMLKVNKIRPASLQKFLNGMTEADLDFFTAFELFHFTFCEESFAAINDIVSIWIEKQFSKIAEGQVDTEAVLTVLEVLATPYILNTRKEQYLSKLAELYDVDKLSEEMSKTKELFIKWCHYNLYEQIQTINSEEAY